MQVRANCTGSSAHAVPTKHAAGLGRGEGSYQSELRSAAGCPWKGKALVGVPQQPGLPRAGSSRQAQQKLLPLLWVTAWHWRTGRFTHPPIACSAPWQDFPVPLTCGAFFPRGPISSEVPHQAPAVTSPRESHFTAVSTDPCSHTVSSHTRVARGWPRTPQRGAGRRGSSKQGLLPWALGRCTALVPGFAPHCYAPFHLHAASIL